MVNNAGEELKKVRKEVGLSQKDLECDGIDRHIISRIERGQQEITTEYAIKIANKINLEMKKRNIKLKYEVTATLFLGIKENSIDRLVSNLKENTKYAIHEIDDFLSNCTDELGEKLINRIYEEVLKKEMYRYKREILKYSSKLFEFVKCKKKITEAHIRLINATMLEDDSGKYKRIMDRSESIWYDLECCDEIEQAKFYHNVSIACRYANEYDKGLELIEKSKKIKNNPYEIKMLNNEAVIYTKQEKYKKAINVYKKILQKSNSEDDIANSYSNLADIYNTIGEIDLAMKYICKAFELIDKVNNHYRYNLNYVRLQIEMNQRTNIANTLENILICIKSLSDRVRCEKILLLVKGFYEFDINKLSEMVEILHKIQIETRASILMDIYPLITNEDIRKMIFEIPRY